VVVTFSLPSPNYSRGSDYKLKTNKNEYATNLWTVPIDGGEPRQFTSGNKDSHPRWSPDGQRIAFISGREKHSPQIYLIDRSGGEAVKLTNFPEGSLSGFRWSPDGSVIAVRFREQDPEWTQQAKKHREEKGLTTPPRVIDDSWYRLDGDGYPVTLVVAPPGRRAGGRARISSPQAGAPVKKIRRGV
jgi:Tol biopolymer transport system component